jgi:hypothetical protein
VIGGTVAAVVAGQEEATMVSRAARSSDDLAIREDFRIPFHINFRAVIGGTIVALGVWAMLLAFGLALGLTSIDPDDADSLRGSGIFTGIWGLAAPIVALLIGAWVAARSAGRMNRTGAAVHGAVVWGLTTVLAVWMLGRLTSAVVGGAVDAGRTAVAAGAQIVPSVGEASAAARGLGIDADAALAPVNARLAAEGKPKVTPEQVRAAAGEVITDAARTGKLDRDTMTAALADRTALSRADAREVAGRIDAQLSRARNRVGEVAGQVQRGALEAAETTGKALWFLFGALLLGLLAALGGGILGLTPVQLRRASRAMTAEDEEADDMRREIALLREEVRVMIDASTH